MSEVPFGQIADSLRREVVSFHRDRGQELADATRQITLETNSGFVERRGRLLLELLYAHTELDSIEGLRVLELGCGFGALAAYFAAQGAEVTGVDSNGERLSVGRAVAAEHTLSLQFQRGKMQALELADSSYDLAVQNNSLCYLVERSDRSAALTEALRVLRPGGRLIVRNPNRWHPRDQFTGLPLIQLLPPGGADRLTALLGRPRSRVRLNSPLEAMRELRGTGFEDVQLVSPPSSPWPAFARPFARYQHLIARRRA